MATATATTTPFASTHNDRDSFKILLPYGLAIMAQLPMLFLYFKKLWEQPHYQFFPFAIIATIVLAWMRWPRGNAMPFHRSVASDIMLVFGFGSAIMGLLFVEPWFSAFSVFMIATSLLARTSDDETGKSLWACALPLFVCLALPFNLDSAIITRLQAYSAQFASQLLDLILLPHYMNGVLISVPSGQQYGVEEACSGVVSFFTLLAITTAFIVWTRRIASPHPVVAAMLIVTGVLISVIEAQIHGFGFLTVLGIALILIGIVGFRASLLLMSAVFWALLMNTVRILLIPYSEINLGIELAHGFWHDILGYVVLIIGVLLILSTDQFLSFLFGPVEAAGEESANFQKPITRFWNRFLAGEKSEDDIGSRSSRKKPKSRKPVSPTGRALIWTASAIVIGCGLFQLWDVKQSMAHPEYRVRFFDSDVTTDFQKSDVPDLVGDNWKQADYDFKDRTKGSDLGLRSDSWQFKAPRCIATVSLDQTFPGWHELTTCYKNVGWNLVSRTWHEPETTEGEQPWQFIEARFERETGEKGYLLFSHFDAFGDPVVAPENWGTLNSLLIRAKNRLSNRIRASLFDSAIYQTQIWSTSFNEIDDEVKTEIQDRYMEIREILRQKFIEKRAAEATK